MKQVEIKMMVDLEDPNQLKAVTEFFSAMSGSAPAESVTQKPADAKPPKKDKPTKVETHVETQDNAGSGTKTEPKVETSGEEQPKIEEVRTWLNKKVDDHRDQIKKKLTSLGANNVSTLDPSHFAEFLTFLKGLE